MIDARTVETKSLGQDNLKYTHITILVTIQTSITGMYQKHISVYSGLDNEQAEIIRKELGKPSLPTTKKEVF
jgi:hypothetical protein